MLPPEAGGRGAGNGNAALFFLEHMIHNRRTVMHLADLISTSRKKENALRGGRFSRVDMGHDADIANFI